MDFNFFYQNNFSKVQLFCQKWTGNIDDAKDIAQDSFIELMKCAERGCEVDNPISWVYRVAYNRCVNHHKFRLRFEGNFSFRNRKEDGEDDERYDLERIARVRKALKSLNSKEKALVTLYKLGFSYKEMASIIDINPLSVGKMLARSIDKLARLIK
jgi:RNA polymerase sigma-70 factor, ECF subfamily